MVAQELENYKDLIDLIPKIRLAVKKGMELESQTKTHNIKRIKMERKFVSEGLSLLQGKWTIDIIYVLMLLKDPYFNEIKRALPEINSRTLVDRLRFLEKRGIVNRIIETQQQIRVKYKLSEFGQGIYEILLAFLFYFVIPKKSTKV